MDESAIDPGTGKCLFSAENSPHKDQLLSSKFACSNADLQKQARLTSGSKNGKVFATHREAVRGIGACGGSEGDGRVQGMSVPGKKRWGIGLLAAGAAACIAAGAWAREPESITRLDPEGEPETAARIEGWRERLDETFPGLSDRYVETYGDETEVLPDNCETLTRKYRELSDTSGMIWDKEELKRYMREYKNKTVGEQLSFDFGV